MRVRQKTRGMISVLLAVLLLCGGAGPAFGSDIVTAISGLVSIDNSITPLLSLEVSRQDPAVIGETFTIVYLVRNISDKPAYEVDLDFSVVDSVDLYPFTPEKPAPISTLEPGASATVSVNFAVDPKARESTYRLNGWATCKDATMSATITHPPAQTTVSTTFTTVEPNLTVENLQVLEENPDTLEGFTLRITLKNGSLLYDLRNVLVQLDGGENFEITDITNKKEIPHIGAYMPHEIDFKLRSLEGRQTNTLKMTTSFNYTNGAAEPHEETLFIPIPEDDDSNGKRPQVIIKRYTLSKEQVLAGDRIDLTLEIENTNSRPVKNVLINFGVESTSSEGTSSSSTVFAPVGSSNTFHVDEIRGKAVIANTITFAVDTSAIARTYIVPVTITYEDEKGLFDNLVVRDNVNIPVTQQAKLSVTSMELPSSAMMGMPTPVMAEFVNSGKMDLADFTVRLEGDFDTMDATVYVAKLAIGAMNSYTGMVVPTEEGDKEGKLIVSYLDNSNQEVVEEYPFTVTVTPAEDMGGMDPGMMPPGMEGGMPGEEEGNVAVRFAKAHWLVLLLGLVVLIQLIAIIRIKRKKKEEFFDE